MFLLLPVSKSIEEEKEKLRSIAKMYSFKEDYTKSLEYYDKTIDFIKLNFENYKNLLASLYYEKSSCMYHLRYPSEEIIKLLNQAKEYGYDECKCNEQIKILLK